MDVAIEKGSNEGSGLHGLPRLARDSSGQRRKVADLQIQCSRDLRQVPLRD